MSQNISTSYSPTTSTTLKGMDSMNGKVTQIKMLNTTRQSIQARWVKTVKVHQQGSKTLHG
jgi:sulfite reductase beta subunit-like hemoprotein